MSVRIFAVEDDALTGALLRQYVGELGYEFAGKADNGEAALEEIRRTRPDLVLMDIRLHGAMDGVGLAARLRDDNATGVLFLSAYADEDVLARAKLTEPYGYLMPVGVVVPAKDRAHFLPYVTSDEHIRLSAMLQDTKLHIGVANGRSYGPVIDGLLEPLLQSGAAHVQKVYQGESTKTLTTMLGLNRFHYMLAYPIEAVFYQEPGNALLFYPVEGGDQLLEGRFGCTKGAETDRVFADVAQLVGSKKTWQPFLTAYERWLPPTLIKQYRKKLANLPKH